MTTEDLDKYNFSSFSGFNAKLINWRYEILAKYFKGSSCLELGSADGMGTEQLLKHFDRVVAVDGSPQAIKDLEAKIKSDKLETIASYFEELELDEKFDTIVLAHILEHVDDPIEILEIAKKFLKDDGVIICDVPNGNSLHRQVGVKMGMLKEKTELNDADHSIGHKRVYTPDTFKADIEKAGFKVDEFGGMFIKVVGNAQTEEVFNDEQLKAFTEVGADNPEIAAEIFVVASI